MDGAIDAFLGRAKVREMTTLSYPTINRLQRAGRFPKYEQISAGRVGLRKSILTEFLNGRRDWSTEGTRI